MARYVRFFVSYFPVIKKLSALFLACRIIKVSFRLSEKRQLWEYNIRAVLKISAQWSASRVQRPESSVQRPGSNVQIPESSIQSPASRVQRPGSSVQGPESSVQSPASNSCIQSPGIPVCLLGMPCFLWKLLQQVYLGQTFVH